MMSDNRFECGCERGGDCTKTTMCALQSALEDRDAEIERLRKRLKEHKLHNDDLRAVVDAAQDMRDDYEQYGFISGKGYVDPQHDEKILHKLDAALAALEDDDE